MPVNDVPEAVANVDRREFPRRDKQPILQQVDDNGDVIFRFKIDTAKTSVTTLREFYRQNLIDLLRIVRLYANGQPVIVDAFAFLNEPHEQIPLLEASAIDGTQAAADRT